MPQRTQGTLPIPINVEQLEEVLMHHPDHAFVARLCSNLNMLKHGADICNGLWVERFPKEITNCVSTS